ncbi:MAG TPA: methanogenesis marker protein 11 [Candidatus Bathyarchaeia archaeon]|nr:methanogenesis marker protein 11 [Candidatus Bathyarchaeia archaeon]
MAAPDFSQLPWIVPYQDILAIAGTDCVELLEVTNCYGGAAWARYHYTQTSPLIISSRTVGSTTRYLLRVGTSNLKLRASVSAGGIESVEMSGDTVKVTYAGLGGGGVGATMCRALARDVINYDLTPAGGSKMSRGTLTLPKRSRVIVGVDDTDTKEEGATWSLVNNIAAMVDNRSLRYVSHAIVQLYPVKAKTKNCVATVVEFASLNANKPIKKFQELLEDYTLSAQTGMAVLNAFGAESLSRYGDAARSGEVSLAAAMEAADAAGVEVLLQGRGIIGAIAALPFFSQCDQSVKLDQIPRSEIV